ncbi:hypothetical protein ASE33_17930 [Pseudomonas sp. Root9]|nr:hypothetical protein ASE33_17930 [Pseudomonas sp. Root9]
MAHDIPIRGLIEITKKPISLKLNYDITNCTRTNRNFFVLREYVLITRNHIFEQSMNSARNCNSTFFTTIFFRSAIEFAIFTGFFFIHRFSENKPHHIHGEIIFIAINTATV